MSGHTPETWENPRFTAAPYSIWCGNTQIATTRWTQDDGSVSPECVQDDNEAKANASLMAAAPKALVLARYAVDNPDFDSAEFDRMAREFIAEATGEQP